MVAERLDRQGFEPDTWILMGSLAIAVVAGHHVHQQAGSDLADSMRMATALAWIVATFRDTSADLFWAVTRGTATEDSEVRRRAVDAGVPARHVRGLHRCLRPRNR